MGYVCPRGLELLPTGGISQVVRAIACFSSVTSKPSLAKSASDVLVWFAAWKSRNEDRTDDTGCVQLAVVGIHHQILSQFHFDR